MREIKFRCFEKVTDQSQGQGMNYNQPFCHAMIRNNDGFYIMQYTGLKDKNGKEIYESDVVRFTHETGYNEYDVITEEVKYYNGGFTIAWAFNDNFCDECEIIGNIYENPELLNSQQ